MECTCGRYEWFLPPKSWWWDSQESVAVKPFSFERCTGCGDLLNRDGTISRAAEQAREHRRKQAGSKAGRTKKG